ncbi:histidinol-phosphatase HisJ family protein [Sporosarcina gallistercoris]|uniref:Histidinol-phosphatase n=1 Tax=Sporosarcina gallistercoris TaxID=2762245 RepID=A0ABR8PI30_9BACL|nr:histidinol-phosphatase HisJ family protein [Sporosarcina gallistercoris]MBD7907836.1 histidinol-phosphatase HisJ family protein [Sporosarcina gallistercoris]
MFDYHMHTSFSADCEVSPEDMIQSAIQKGLTEICITDHVDYDYPDRNFVFEFDQQAYKEKIESLRERRGNEIQVKRGVEIGVQPHLLDRYTKLIQDEQFDFVICSLHTVEKQDLHFGAIFENRTLEGAFTAYYQELLRCIRKFDAYSVLGHVDLIKRYAKQVPSQDFLACLKEIFNEIIPRGKGIEMNTSGVRYGLPTAMPSPDILELYKACGGEILTIGSDAHKPLDVGFDIRKSLQLASDIGFRFIATYDKGEPQFHSIEKLLR